MQYSIGLPKSLETMPLRKLYCDILALEAKILSEDSADESGLDDGRVVVQGRRQEISDEDPEV
jgi:hypothetical protein